ncbi:MAG: phosphomethylpyrimidine synthase ThiC [Clostridiales bacterium]
MNYKTQMEAAKKGIVTELMKIVSEKESIDLNLLVDLVKQGKVIIPANINHKSLCPEGIGQGLRTKINVNLGISKDCCDIDLEMDKVKKAIELKAEAIMDLSSFGKTKEFRKKLIDYSKAMVGTVPVYDAVGFYDKDLSEITSEEFLKVVLEHAKDGVDFMTIHAGVNRETVKRFKNNKRLTNIVSRGGALLFSWMELTGNENPFYEYYDEILEIFREYDVTISLGDGMRPGSINDATDSSQIQELIVLGELTKRAWEKDVQVMVEGPGHMSLNEIVANMTIEKKLCYGAPFYVLGPLVTDIAPGYDHITSAIGGAIAAANGADFLCYVTPAEHLRLPNIDDMKEGIIASRIAAHAADIAIGIKGAKDWDYKMSEARKNLNWEEMIRLSIDPEKASKYREDSIPEDAQTCTMCGKMCAIKNMNDSMEGKGVKLI